MSLNEKDTQVIVGYFRNQPVLRAYLFGSYARNEADSNSDVDILVELDYTKHIGLGFVSMKKKLEQLLNRPVDLVSSQSVSEIIAPFIDKDKQLIYER